MKDLKYYLPGVFIVFMGIVIAVFPEILVILLATLIMTIGIAALVLGHIVRKAHIQGRRSEQWLSGDDFSGDSFEKVPFWRNWFVRF